MKNQNDDYIETEPKFFIERRQYFNLLAIGVLPWEMRAYLSPNKKIESMSRKPLFFQEKIKDDSSTEDH